jgi:hypothetical protein
MAAVCEKCGSYLLPIGDGRYATCSSAIDGKCDKGGAVDNPGWQECLRAYAHQVLPFASYDKHAKQWKLADGTPVGKGKRAWRHVDWGKTRTPCGLQLAQFGKRRRICIVQPRPIEAGAVT